MKPSKAISALFEPVFDRLGFLAVNAPAFFGAFTRHAHIAYGADPQHHLDVYVPQEAAAAPRPMVVFWHGGRWRFGDKRDYRFVGAALAGAHMAALLTLDPRYFAAAGGPAPHMPPPWQRSQRRRAAGLPRSPTLPRSSRNRPDVRLCL